MKIPDRMNFLPIDSIKAMSEIDLYEIKTSLGSVICGVNYDKINFEEIDELSKYEQSNLEVTLEKITDIELYNSSKRKEGFENYNIKLSEIDGFKIFRP